MLLFFTIEFKSSIQKKKKSYLKSRLPEVAKTTLTLKEKKEG